MRRGKLQSDDVEIHRHESTSQSVDINMMAAESSENGGRAVDRSFDVLEKMINPPNDDWGFLDMWGNSQKILD
jgi:hypothetical protein